MNTLQINDGYTSGSAISSLEARQPGVLIVVFALVDVDGELAGGVASDDDRAPGVIGRLEIGLGGQIGKSRQGARRLSGLRHLPARRDRVGRRQDALRTGAHTRCADERGGQDHCLGSHRVQP